MASNFPPIRLVRRHDTHRLIPSKYNPDLESVLGRIADNDTHLRAIFDLDHATNERLAGENGLLPGISNHELLFGVPNYRVVNAAFTHAHPLGSRFNGPDRGAWYAAFAVETAQKEVAFQKRRNMPKLGVLRTASPTMIIWQISAVSFTICETLKAGRRLWTPTATSNRKPSRNNFLRPGRSGSCTPAFATRVAHAWLASAPPWWAT